MLRPFLTNTFFIFLYYLLNPVAYDQNEIKSDKIY